MDTLSTRAYDLLHARFVLACTRGNFNTAHALTPRLARLNSRIERERARLARRAEYLAREAQRYARRVCS